MAISTTDDWSLDGIPPQFWPRVRVQQIVSMKLAAVAVKQIAARLPPEQGRGLIAATSAASADWDGELCPSIKWPFPGPRPHWATMAAAGELVDLASTLPEASRLRADIAMAASELAEQASKAMLAAGDMHAVRGANGASKLAPAHGA